MVWYDLVEPAPGGDLSKPPLATLPVVLFDDARRQVNARLAAGGTPCAWPTAPRCRVRGRPGYWPRGGRLQLQMSDIDPDFTLGRLAADRERLLRRLDGEGLLARQSELPPPLVPLRLGLVTSAGSAAEHDVLDELRRSGIGFRVFRADVRVQGYPTRPGRWRGGWGRSPPGASTPCCWCGAAARPPTWRPSTARLIARAIAGLDVPVLTGIGHDIDRTVADEVAHAGLQDADGLCPGGRRRRPGVRTAHRRGVAGHLRRGAAAAARRGPEAERVRPPRGGGDPPGVGRRRP